MFDWITWPATLGFLGGAVSGPLLWLAGTFVASPIKDFRALRRDVILALNEHSRYVSCDGQSVDVLAIFDFSIMATQGQRAAAGDTFGRLGHRLLALARNDPWAMLALSLSGVRAVPAAHMLIDLRNALSEQIRIGPSRE